MMFRKKPRLQYDVREAGSMLMSGSILGGPGVFLAVSEYCWSNVKFIDITLSLVTILLFIF